MGEGCINLRTYRRSGPPGAWHRCCRSLGASTTRQVQSDECAHDFLDSGGAPTGVAHWATEFRLWPVLRRMPPGGGPEFTDGAPRSTQCVSPGPIQEERPEPDGGRDR
jgi:hypothetical protein